MEHIGEPEQTHCGFTLRDPHLTSISRSSRIHPRLRWLLLGRRDISSWHCCGSLMMLSPGSWRKHGPRVFVLPEWCNCDGIVEDFFFFFFQIFCFSIAAPTGYELVKVKKSRNDDGDKVDCTVTEGGDKRPHMPTCGCFFCVIAALWPCHSS